ncbi:conserved hypothetical protein [Rubrivivax sp. A210]|uniref:DUF2946 domain-containing protein n=1 Tax=Rubrivivax sp. A210 TaxID=2772301 RepID=UPI001919D9B9|nr:DUF2946 domain-containing protein [Rubrivivax sp. A210]CAD5373829.1 conserved hypothetical protein [Rubrivivax sp. A210]
MHGLRRHRIPTTWLTLVILVLATLAPGLSRAIAFAGGDGGMAGLHCLMAPEAMGDGQATPAQTAAGVLDHCPLCMVRGDSPAPPPTALLLPDGQGLTQAAPATVALTPRFVLAWRGAQPRAPPALT